MCRRAAALHVAAGLVAGGIDIADRIAGRRLGARLGHHHLELLAARLPTLGLQRAPCGQREAHVTGQIDPAFVAPRDHRRAYQHRSATYVPQ